MQFSLILTSFFCFTTWINLVQADIGSSGNRCPCVKVSEIIIPHSNIMTYTSQKKGECLVSAVAFRTVKGQTICSDPNDRWAKHVIQQLKKRRNEKISTGGTPPQSTRTSAQSTSTSPLWSGPSSTSSPASLLGSEPTLAPSTKTSTSSTGPPSMPSSSTLASVSTQSTPNPTSASASLSNTIAGTSGTTSANDRIPGTSMKTRNATTQRRQRTRKKPRRNMKKWQRRCKSKSK